MAKTGYNWSMTGENIGASQRLSALNRMTEGFIGNPSPAASAELSAGIKDHFTKLAAKTAQRNAALDARIAGIKATRDEALARIAGSKPKLILGMKPSTAVLGAVAVGSAVYVANQFFRGAKKDTPPRARYWQDRIMQQREAHAHDGRQL